MPAGWANASIGDVVVPIASIDPGKHPAASIDYIDIASIDSERGVVAAPKSISGADAPSRARQAVHEGDVLFSTVRPYLRAIASVPMLESPVASTGFCVLRPAPGVDCRYLLHWVRSTEFIDGVLPLQRGSSYPAVRDADVHAQPLPLPPTAEQERIAEAVDELIGGIETAAAELVEAKRKLALYRQSLLKSAVEGTLTAEWRGNESTSAWSSATIGDLAEVGTGVTPLRSNSRYFGGGTIPWVTSGALNAALVTAGSEFVTEAAVAECRLKLYPPGTLLVAMYGEGKTRGKCSELAVAATINQAIAAIVLKPAFEKCRAFLKAFLWHSYESMRQQASGGVQPNLNLQIVKSISVPLPPLDEQQEIVRRLDTLLDAATVQEEALGRALAMVAAQRQNILRAAFSGQLVPQDPNDEPASVLLERIRAQRNAAADKPAARRPRKAKIAA